MNRNCLFIVALAVAGVLCGCAGWHGQAATTPTAEEIRAHALVEAKRQNKRVLLWFVDSNSIWSDCLDEFHAAADAAAILHRYFVLARIHLRDTPGGEQLYLETGGIRGAPAFSLLDANGALLADSGSDEDHNIGFPTKPYELESYRDAIQAACPEVTEDELDLLHETLVKIRQRQAPP